MFCPSGNDEAWHRGRKCTTKWMVNMLVFQAHEVMMATLSQGRYCLHNTRYSLHGFISLHTSTIGYRSVSNGRWYEYFHLTRRSSLAELPCRAWWPILLLISFWPVSASVCGTRWSSFSCHGYHWSLVTCWMWWLPLTFSAQSLAGSDLTILATWEACSSTPSPAWNDAADLQIYP